MTTDDSYERKINAELDRLQAELDKLKASASRAKAEQRIRFDRYLSTLEKKKEEISDKVDTAKESDEEAMSDIKRSLTEAWDRLAIAKKAAQARFH